MVVNVANLGLSDTAVKFLSAQGYDELYPPQADSVEAGLLEDKSLLVSAPTASGKTLIGMLAMIRHLLRRGDKKLIIYLSPLRALASEKYQEFKKLEKLEGDAKRIRVGISTGDFAGRTDRRLGERYDVLVMTNERMDLAIRRGADWIDNVGLIIIDEVHLIGDEGRGPTLEMILTRMKMMQVPPQVVGLSATVTNAKQIADWLSCALVDSDWRPVPLAEGVCRQSRVTMGDGSKFKVERSKAGLAVDLGLQSLVSDGGQSLVFASTRGRSKSFAAKAAPVVCKLLKKTEARWLAAASKKILSGNARTGLVVELAALVNKGVAFHHAGLGQASRQVVEDGFRRGYIKLLSSTPTLAAGVNLPARRVVISSLNRYDAKAGGSRPISVLEYKQLCGRAGRPQYDTMGEAITVTGTCRISDVMKHYVHGKPEPVRSKIGGQRSLRTHVLSIVVTNPGILGSEVLEFFLQTLGGQQLGKKTIRSGVASSLHFLESQDLIVKKGGRYAATEFGKKASALYVDPLTVTYFRDAVRKSALGMGAGPGRHTFGFLHLISSCEEFFPKFGLRYDDYEMAYWWIDKRISEAIMPISVQDCSRSLLALDMWVNERSELELSDTLGMESGDMHRLADAADWLTYCLREVSRFADVGEHVLEELAVLRIRLAYGIREELAKLVQVKGIGRVRARALYESGIKSIDDLVGVSAIRLAKVDKIGPAVARSIKSEIKKM